jgi:macrolide transport system ATP-binding/permease protein
VEIRRALDLPITVLAGRLPAPGSLTEVAVTPGYLERLHIDPDHPAAVVGTELDMAAPRVFPALSPNLRGMWERATIVGVVAQEAGPGDVLAPIQQARRAQAFTLRGPPPGEGGAAGSAYGGAVVIARTLDDIAHVRHQITAIGYSTSAPENLIATVLRYLHVVEIVLMAIGLIALVIAALGIANALFAAVRERRREIGVLKAICARDRDIRRVFLTEAMVVGLVGGLIGALAGRAIAGAVAAAVNSYLIGQGLLGVALVAPASVVAATIGGSVAVALLAGAIPATRAARLPARAAMGEE